MGVQSTYIILFQWIVGGLLGNGVDVLSLVDMELNMEVGGLSDRQEMGVGDVQEVVDKEHHVLLEENVQARAAQVKV